MATLTIPRKITNGKELMIIPKEDWERILELAKKNIRHLELDAGLRKALTEVKSGKLVGPFGKVSDLIRSLER